MTLHFSRLLSGLCLPRQELDACLLGRLFAVINYAKLG
jgi:hypothetical protein